MGVMDSIAKGFRTATASRGLLLLLFAVGFVWNMINIPLASRLQQANAVVSVVIVLLSVAFIVVNIFLQAGSLSYLRDFIKSGRSDLGQFSANGTKYFLRFLGISVIIGLYVIILTVLATIVVLLGGENPNPFSIAVAAIIAVLGILGLLFLFLAPYALIADDAKVIGSFRTSIGLVKRDFLKVLAIAVLLILIAIGAGLVVGVIFGFFAAFLKGIANQIVVGFFSSLVNAYLGLAFSAAFMAYYLSAKTSQPTTP